MEQKPTTKRGGNRRGAGRKPINPGEPMGHTTITVDEATLRKLKVLGNNNVSEGVRIAADVAYARYQATP